MAGSLRGRTSSRNFVRAPPTAMMCGNINAIYEIITKKLRKRRAGWTRWYGFSAGVHEREGGRERGGEGEYLL